MATNNIFGISEESYNSVMLTIKPIVTFYKSLCSNDSIMEVVGGCLPDKYGDKKHKLLLLFGADIMKNIQKMGYSTSSFKNKEGFAITALFFGITSSDGLSNMVFKFIFSLIKYSDY